MTVWYFPLEPVRSRYTYQLCEEWMPPVLLRVCGRVDVMRGEPLGDDVTVGQVLDATGRGHYALSQVAAFLRHLRAGDVADGDVVYLQDFWTPGLEAVFYAAHLYGLRLRVYAMLHAQSVDEFDFTHAMLPWIRWFELGADAGMSGVFVASTVHREQLRRAGFRAPVHVIGLPFPTGQVRSQYPDLLARERANAVVFSSRLDAEKNPTFMLRVAQAFLYWHPQWEWWVTTSAAALRSNQPGAVEEVTRVAASERRFRVFTGLSKAQYYERLATARVQFNCSLQDYVSWTLCEAAAFGCELCYPDFRSFPECVPDDRRYYAFDASHAGRVLDRAIDEPRTHLGLRVLDEAWKEAMVTVLRDGVQVDTTIF